MQPVTDNLLRYRPWRGELHDPAAERHRVLGRYIADPVVGQVRTGHDKIAGTELANEIAHEVATRCGDDVVDLAFRVEVPPDSTKGIAMAPGGESLTLSDLNHLEIRFHVDVLPVLAPGPRPKTCTLLHWTG